ncbi:MAG: 5'/3'-nucleotidase SurE [Pseudomonadota bacterium]
MRILVTNDDGIAAPGLEVLQSVARNLSDDVWTVAPETDQSGVSRSLTLHEPLRCRELAAQTFAVKGTPADCVIMATRHILGETLPDLILSGVNRGQNLADDVHYSGTIAGAMEGAMLSIPSLAFSLALKSEDGFEAHWDTPLSHAPELVSRLLEAGWDKNTVLNLNFPACKPQEVAGTVLTSQGRRSHGRLAMDERHDTWGRPYYWFGFAPRRREAAEGTDTWAVQTGKISITPLQADMTDHALKDQLAKVFEKKPA